MTILFIVIVLIIAFIILRATVLTIKGDRLLRKVLPDDVPADDEWVIVLYKGKEIPMTYLQKIEMWDNMPGSEKGRMVKKLDKAIERGKARPENFGRIRHQLKVYEE